MVSKKYFPFWIGQAVRDGTNVSLYFLDLMSRGTADGFHKCSRDWMSGGAVLAKLLVFHIYKMSLGGSVWPVGL